MWSHLRNIKISPKEQDKQQGVSNVHFFFSSECTQYRERTLFSPLWVHSLRLYHACTFLFRVHRSAPVPRMYTFNLVSTRSALTSHSHIFHPSEYTSAPVPRLYTVFFPSEYTAAVPQQGHTLYRMHYPAQPQPTHFRHKNPVIDKCAGRCVHQLRNLDTLTGGYLLSEAARCAYKRHGWLRGKFLLIIRCLAHDELF